MKYKLKELMKTDVSKVYIMGVAIFCLLLLGGYFSYAMFTVNKEKNRAISIVTGTLEYELKVNDNATNTITVGGNSNATYTINLNNTNNRDARLNFYYIGDLPSGVDAGYIVEEGTDTPPGEKGEVFSKAGSNGDKKVYKIKVVNSSSSSVNINLGVQIGLDYNDLSLPSNGHLFTEYVVKASDTIIENVGDNGGTYDDGTDTFITGTNPNNYVWYSGKLWRAVSINNSAKTIKLVTQWNISTIHYSSGSSPFEGSFMEEWLNDTSTDGFLGNLRDYENFIVTDAKWDNSFDTTALGSIQRPKGTTIATDPVGLLNIYEYQSSYKGTTYTNGYLNNGLIWYTITPYDESFGQIRYINANGSSSSWYLNSLYGIRPSIVLKSNVKIASGTGTEADPYRLSGDNDTDLNGVKLNTRYSGEYIQFGNDENNLYRIVNHETEGLTKITSNEPLKKSGTFIESEFNDNNRYFSYSTIKDFLNDNYLTDYIEDNYINMIEDETTWYQGTVYRNKSYKLAKYKDVEMSGYASIIKSKVGLLRYGELMSGQFNKSSNNKEYWLITEEQYGLWYVEPEGYGNVTTQSPEQGVKPSMNLKENVIITGGDGTKNNPFTLALG